MRLPDALMSRLWPHQRGAMEVVDDFLRARGGSEGPSALVRMPTGTGKSGVIAIAAQQLVPVGDVLLLTPWDALVTQLLDDVGHRFWTKVGVPAPSHRQLARILPSTAASALAARTEPTIWLATIATLQRLHAADDPAYSALRDRLRLVVVDEGHYEPARSWSDAVRGLRRPTILFTATPYRNDAKYFDVDDRHQFHYSHAQAVDDRIVRRVEFEPSDFHDTESFCSELLRVVRLRGLDEVPDAKVIVRCESMASIQNVVSELLLRGERVVGIHERFDTGADVLRRRVPRPDECDARFWVHQFKLTEGIDSEAFRAVAFFAPLPTERAFVQQVGRILRNPRRSPDEVAVVMRHRSDSLQASWQAYEIFDRQMASGISRSPAEIALAQPTAQYFDGKFRDTFNIEGAVEPADLLYPPSVKIYRVGPEFDIGELSRFVRANLDENDCVRQKTLEPAPNMRVHVYLAISSSPLLARAAYYQPSLGFTTYRQIGSYLFFNDSFGLRPDWLDRLPIVGTEQLQRLYYGDGARLASVSLSNTSLGQFSARRRTLHARSIAELGPDLSDHAQLATTSTGIFTASDDQGGLRYVSRYVGFSRARVSDRGLLEFDAYLRWLDDIAAALDDGSAAPLPVFGRFAATIDAPANTTPASILLDFDPGQFVDRQSAARDRLWIDDLCMEVIDGSFVCTANADAYPVTIRWDNARRRYLLACPELDRRFSSVSLRGGPSSRSLIGYLNSNQAFRVVPAVDDGEYCIYTGNRFCKPRLPLGLRAASDSPDLTELIEGVAELGRIGSEKGEPGSATAAGWGVHTVFGFIDSLGRGSSAAGLMAGIDLLVCDDMGAEIADFIALDSGSRRVIAMHAKAFRRARPLSASALHEVSSQALKNLGSFQPYSIGEPPNLALWGRAWDGPAGTVDRRIRIGSGTPTQAWRQIREALRDPRTTREIWIVLGQGPSKSQVLAASRQPRPRPEVVQMMYSLQSTWGAVSSVGARLRLLSSA